MAIIHKIMKTFTRPDGDDIVQYEIVDENGRKMIAPNWYEHEDDAFTAGQHIEKDGVLYRFLAPHTAESAWNSNEVTAVDVGEEIEAIVTDLNQKASKVSGATNGNFAALDGNGNLTDSGKKPSDFLTEHQDISGKADKDTDAVEGNFAAFDSNGNPIDSGHKHSDYLTSHQDISGKADKVTGGTADNLAALDASGNLKDSGTSATELKSAIDGKAAIITDTVTNVAIASVPDGAANLPLTALRFAVEPIQAGSGDPSPTNVRPITGRTGAVVTRTGGNLLNQANNEAGYYIGSNGAKASGGSTVGITEFIRVKPNTTYAWSGLGAVGSTAARHGAEYASADFSSFVRQITGQNNDSGSFTTSEDTNYIVMNVVVEGTQQQIVEGSTALPYTAYTGTQHTVQFGSTVYGGQIDWVNGQMVIDRAMVTVDENTSFDTANTAFYAEDVFPEGVAATLATGNFICNKYKCENSITTSTYISDRSDMSFFNQTSKQAYKRRLFVKDSRFNTAAAFQASLETEPIVIVYPLPTPITLSLSNLDEIRTVLGGGTMNLWSDSGDIVEMTYPCDTKLYIDKKFTELQALLLENS